MSRVPKENIEQLAKEAEKSGSLTLNAMFLKKEEFKQFIIPLLVQNKLRSLSLMGSNSLIGEDNEIVSMIEKALKKNTSLTNLEGDIFATNAKIPQYLQRNKSSENKPDAVELEEVARPILHTFGTQTIINNQYFVPDKKPEKLSEKIFALIDEVMNTYEGALKRKALSSVDSTNMENLIKTTVKNIISSEYQENQPQQRFSLSQEERALIQKKIATSAKTLEANGMFKPLQEAVETIYKKVPAEPQKIPIKPKLK